MRIRVKTKVIEWGLIRSATILSVVFLSKIGLAASDRNNLLPDPLPGGIVYPGFTTAVGINPAGLTGKTTLAAEGFASPAIWGSSDIGAGLAACAAFDSFGFGVNVAGISVPQSVSNDSWTAAGAFRMESVSLGFSVNSSVIPGSIGASQPLLNLGLVYGPSGTTGVSFAGTLNNLNGVLSVLTLGVGYGEEGRYHLEFNFQTPALSNLFVAGSTYGLDVGVTVYAGIFGASFLAIGSVTPISASAYSFSAFALSENVSLLVRPISRLLISLYFTGGSSAGIPGAASGSASAPTFAATYLLL